jgi:hypothetical protein
MLQEVLQALQEVLQALPHDEILSSTTVSIHAIHNEWKQAS